MRLAIAITCALAVTALLGSAAASAAVPCASVIVNGGVDSGGPADPSIQVPPGWQTTGQFDALQYGGSDAPPPPTATSGPNYMWGGQAALSTGTQTINLSGAAPEIAGGMVSAQLDGDLGGFQDQEDNAAVDLVWLDAQGLQLGTLRLNPVTAAERGNRSLFVRRSATGGVPAATASVRITVTMTRLGGSDNDGYADNISLLLSPRPSCPPPVTNPPKSVTQPSGSCGNAPGQQVCIGAPSDILKFGCVRIGALVHRFGVKLKKRQGGLLVNRRSRVRTVRFSLDRRASGSDSKRPYFAAVDGSVLRAGTHTLAASVHLVVPKTHQKVTKRLRFRFKTCA
jgi:hypothetical protein